MEEYRSSFRTGGGGDRRLEIVSGRARSPDPPQVAARASQVTSSYAKPWSFNDPETKRKKRIAKYKVYTIEGRMKTSIRNGFRWIKNKCSEIIHGY